MVHNILGSFAKLPNTPTKICRNRVKTITERVRGNVITLTVEVPPTSDT